MKTTPEPKDDIEFEVVLRGNRLRFKSTWGLFSPRGIDNGSYLLIERIEIADGQHTLDLGCGYGAIGVAIARACPGGSVQMLDKDFVAVEYAQANVQLNALDNCKVYLSNGFSAVDDVRFDNVVANLPANAGNEMLYAMMCGAREHLRPGGQFVVVTVSGLKKYIKRNFLEIFGNYKKIKQGRNHTVARAVMPKSTQS